MLYHYLETQNDKNNGNKYEQERKENRKKMKKYDRFLNLNAYF